MIGRFLGLAVAITAVSVGVASIASRSAGDDVGAPATAETQDNSNWTTQRGKRGGRSSGSSAPGATASGGAVRLGRSGASPFYADTEVDGTNIRMMVDSGATLVALSRREARSIGIHANLLHNGRLDRNAGGAVALLPGPPGRS